MALHQFTDTHTHIYLEEFDDDREAVVKRAVDSGVSRMILPNVSPSTLLPMHSLQKAHPDLFRMALGLHPSEVGNDWQKDVDEIEKMLTLSPDSYVAVGEIGIDLYWDKTYEEEQILAFDRQVAIASRINKPIIIHCRDGLHRVLEVLSSHRDVRGVFHCFGGTADDVKKIREIGDFYFGIGGVVTFKNSKLPGVLSEIGLDRILLETDAPYLAPVPFRGKRNESSFLPATAAAVAKALDKEVAEIAERTSANSYDLFSF